MATIQKSLHTQQRKSKALEAFRKLHTVTAACQAVGINRWTWYDWQKSDPGFARAVEAVRNEIAEELEQEAMRRAKEHSDTLLIFLLKALRPEKYRERYQHQVTSADGGPVRVVVSWVSSDST